MSHPSPKLNISIQPILAVEVPISSHQEVKVATKNNIYMVAI
jgi:hypothetical protein